MRMEMYIFFLYFHLVNSYGGEKSAGKIWNIQMLDLVATILIILD